MEVKKIFCKRLPFIGMTLFLVLFIYTATSKLLNYENFETQLGQSPVFTAYADYLVIALPIFELSVAGLFLISNYQLIAYYLSFALMVMFTTYIIIILNFSDFIPCSCGGVLEDLSWSEHIVFNLFFIVLAILGILILETKNQTRKSIKR